MFHRVKLPDFLHQFKGYTIPGETTADGTPIIFIKTKKMANIVDGKLVGSEIVVRKDCFRVWTKKTKMVFWTAKKFGLKYSKYTGSEADLYIPRSLPEQTIISLLLTFGAKKRRVMSPAQRKACGERLTNAGNKGKKPTEAGTTNEVPTPKQGIGRSDTPRPNEMPPTKGAESLAGGETDQIAGF